VVADLLGVTVPRIRRWSFTEDKGGNDGRIPPKHYEALLNAAKERGVPLSPEDFFSAPQSADREPASREDTAA
jgi:hypothetical protein